MNQRQNSSYHKRAVREARFAKLLFAFIAIASLAIVIFILNIPSIINNENKPGKSELLSGFFFTFV